jgi:hypothetical protein
VRSAAAGVLGGFAWQLAGWEGSAGAQLGRSWGTGARFDARRRSIVAGCARCATARMGGSWGAQDSQDVGMEREGSHRRVCIKLRRPSWSRRMGRAWRCVARWARRGCARH